MEENEIIEEWLQIEGFEGLYQVSSYGRVKSIIDRYGNPREKILSQFDNGNGYLQVNLCKDGKVKNCKVHRLVANAFLENPNGYTCVNHKDECKTNNCVDNLEWCTHKYNSKYGTCQERRVASIDWKAIAEKLTNRQDLSKKVFQYTKEKELVAIWTSTREAERNGFNHGAVAACCRGKLKSHRGYIWSYHPL